MAVEVVCAQGEEHRVVCGVLEECDDSGQLDGEGVLAHKEGVLHKSEQGRATGVLHHKVPVQRAEDGAEGAAEVLEVQVPF